MKLGKASVDYTDHAMKPNERCGLCVHFRAASCMIVKGTIKPGGWCKRFRRR